MSYRKEIEVVYEDLDDGPESLVVKTAIPHGGVKLISEAVLALMSAYLIVFLLDGILMLVLGGFSRSRTAMTGTVFAFLKDYPMSEGLAYGFSSTAMLVVMGFFAYHYREWLKSYLRRNIVGYVCVIYYWEGVIRVKVLSRREFNMSWAIRSYPARQFLCFALGGWFPVKACLYEFDEAAKDAKRSGHSWLVKVVKYGNKGGYPEVRLSDPSGSSLQGYPVCYFQLMVQYCLENGGKWPRSVWGIMSDLRQECRDLCQTIVRQDGSLAESKRAQTTLASKLSGLDNRFSLLAGLAVKTVEDLVKSIRFMKSEQAAAIRDYLMENLLVLLPEDEDVYEPLRQRLLTIKNLMPAKGKGRHHRSRETAKA